MMKAIFIRNINNNKADQKLYKVDPPMMMGWDRDKTPVDYVIVSGAYFPYSGPETYIFPANEEGGIIDWTELDGSFRGYIDHEVALENAGYSVESDDDEK